MNQLKEKMTKKTKILIICVAALVGAAALVASIIFLAPVLMKEPHLSLNGKKTVKLEVLTEYKDAGIKAKHGRKDITDKTVCADKVDTSKVGEYKVVYSYKHNKKLYKATRTVKVVDTTPPKLVLKGKNALTVSLIKFYKEPGFEAEDLYEGNLSSKVKVEKTKINDKKYEITYSVTDKSGNTASAVRTVTVDDKVKPVITLNGQYHTYVELGKTYRDSGVTASDDVDGNLTSKILKSGAVNTALEGTYVLSFSVTDKNGNTGTATRKVTVFNYNPSNKNRIFLTFDDGPSSKVTPRVLDILKENDVKATFFICDYSEDKKPIIRRMINEGHTVGIHGLSHDYARIYKSDDAFMKNIYRLRDKLKSDFGYEATLMRFPGGSSNSVSRKYNKGIMGRLVKRVEKEGFIYYDWNVSSGDATAGTVSASRIAKNTINGLVKSRNNVVLMHDSSAKATTAAALPEIINYAKRQGFVFLPLTRDVPPPHHPVSNK